MGIVSTINLPELSVVPSNTIRVSADALRETTSTTHVLCKSVSVNRVGVVRLTFETGSLYSEGSGGGWQIRSNGIVLASYPYVPYNYTSHVVDVPAFGFPIELWLASAYSAPHRNRVLNFKVRYDSGLPESSVIAN